MALHIIRSFRLELKKEFKLLSKLYLIYKPETFSQLKALGNKNKTVHAKRNLMAI